MSSAIAESQPNAWIFFCFAMKKRILFANLFYFRPRMDRECVISLLLSFRAVRGMTEGVGGAR
jgi:hypothetical protein